MYHFGTHFVLLIRHGRYALVVDYPPPPHQNGAFGGGYVVSIER